MTDKKLNKLVGIKIKEARAQASLTGTELGLKLGRSRQWVSAKEQGTNSCTFKDILDIADACNVPITYFQV